MVHVRIVSIPLSSTPVALPSLRFFSLGQSEHSDDEERKGGAEGKNFPEKLYHVLEMPQHAEIIAWGKVGPI